MNKIKKHFLKNKNNYYTLLIATIIISIIYILFDIAPFGKNSMLDVDFYHQYGPLLNELYDRVKAGESLLFSFNTAGGLPFFKNFFNYLSSPFNIILFLFKKENIVMAFSVIIALKVIISSFTMSIYLKNTFKKDNKFLVIMSLLYAFSGYFCAYYWNIMWLDGIVFLPLIMLGINELVDENKPFMYIFSLAIMLFSSYFIGYMICIYSILYFIFYYLLKNKFKVKEFIKKGFLFAISSLLSAGLIAVILLPLYSSLSSISATTDAFPGFSTNFNLLDYIFNHVPSSNRTVFASDILPLPNIYCGLITLVLLVNLFINKNIKVKHKMFVCAALTFFFLCFNIKNIDFIWHAFHVPNDLPWRYSFLYVFTLIIIAYYSYLKIDKNNYLTSYISFAAVLILILFAYKLDFANLSSAKVITMIIFLFSYFICYIFKDSSFFNKKVLNLLLVFCVSFECIYGIYSNWKIDHSIKTFMSDKKPTKELIESIKKEDKDFYRIEKTDYLTLNDPAWYDYYGISTFSSMAYENTSKFQRNFGLAGNNINSYYYRYFQTPIYNSIFNVKYIIGNHIDNNYYSYLDTNENIDLTRFNYNTSIGFLVNKKIKKFDQVSYNPFLNQTNYVLLSTGISDIYERVQATSVVKGKVLDENFINNSNGAFQIESSDNELILELYNPKDQNLYFYIGGANVDSFYINDKYYSITSDESYTLDAGYTYKGMVEVKIKFSNSDTAIMDFYSYSLSDNKFKEFYNKINTNKLNVTSQKDNLIIGNINALEDKTMFTSISYDEGWTIYVDDKKVKTYMIDDSYLGFDINKGKHIVKMVYFPVNMLKGLIVSVISMIFMIMLKFILKNKKKIN